MSMTRDKTQSIGVARMYDEFPAGEEPEDLTIDDLPDDEESFLTVPHYDDRRKNRVRPEVTDDVVSELLESGELRISPDSDDDRYLIQKKIGKYEWTIVVADDRDREDLETDWSLLTVFSQYHGTYGTTNRYRDRYRQRKGLE